MTELLIPAGSLPLLKTAIRYGADAVYIGGEMYGLRAKAKNFTLADMVEGVAYCKNAGKKLYVTANITAHNRDLEGVRKYFTELNEIGPDAVIISDPGVFSIAKETLKPEIAIHISTQANNVNAETFRFWYNLGASRVVCGRELSLREITEIRKCLPEGAEIEAFVHGAMCISYSGRCLLSNYLTGRDANLGACTHPCRWRYALVEETRPGEYLPIEENERGTYIMNSKDLCMISHVPELIAAGIDSFKVEGRMKHALYVATVTRAYRRAIDAVSESLDKYLQILPSLEAEIRACEGRELTTGFYFDHPGADSMSYDGGDVPESSIFLGTIECIGDDGYAEFTQKNKFLVGDTITIMKPNGDNIRAEVTAMQDEAGVSIESCPHPSRTVRILLSVRPETGDVMRMDF
ncbi:MAG: U32 family peptidase [Lachnospiraceae bacterium]|nr:U32 family peptidase [Lachnospiraceae bacterium]